MFEKLTPREKKLVYATAWLVPISVIFCAIFWYTTKKAENFEQWKALSSNIKEEVQRQKDAALANRRKIYYNSVSMPVDVNRASNDYQVWLKMQLSELDMDVKSLQASEGGNLKDDQRMIGRLKNFSLATAGKLDQVTEFLHRFYSVDLLHRIKSLKVVPQTEIVGNDKKVRSGLLSVSITIELLSLADADDRVEFTDKLRELNRTKEEYLGKIVRRNIFGPANNTPTISARPSSSYYSDKSATISVSGADADDNDQLNFEIVDKGTVAGELKLVHKAGDRRAQLVVPPQKADKYVVRVKIADNGFPPKESFKDITVNFKDKPPKKIVTTKAPPTPPPAPPFINAKQTKITAIVQNRDGSRNVWLTVRTTGEKFRLKEGETFDLDERKWIVESVQREQVVLGVDGKLKTFFDGDFLGEPRLERDNPKVTPAAKIQSDLPPLPRVVP
jgi:hypothetical protein